MKPIVLWIAAACTGSAPEPAGCVFSLSQWCANSETAGGPATDDPACPTVTVEERMTADNAWHGRCTERDRGTLEVVSRPTGYGGGTWYFARDRLVAVVWDSDATVFCDGSSFTAAYGFAPDCTDLCLIEAPADTGFVPGLPPPC